MARPPFGQLLAGALDERGLTLRAFAAQAGVSWTFAHKVVQGQRAPTLERLESWADLLNLTGVEREQFIEMGMWNRLPKDVRTWLATHRPRHWDLPRR